MSVAKREHVPVALGCLPHQIYSTAFGYLLSRAFVLDILLLSYPKSNELFIPMDESQGLSGTGVR